MKVQQKDDPNYLPISSSPEPLPQTLAWLKFKALFHALIVAGIVGSLWATALHGGWCHHERKAMSSAFVSGATCAQVGALLPDKHGELWTNLSATIGTSGFRSKAVDWLSGAVQIPTESWDAMDPVGVDPRWKVFEPFQGFLIKAFPLVHTTLKLTKVNTYGLIFEWKGSSSELKPILLAAHQDVVPVETKTIDEWVYPPFSGYFDGERIWGRGSSDDKSGLIGVLASVETLISNGFQPTRTVVLAFGFDEEVSGLHGAARLAPVLLDLYGEDGFAFIIDEGAGFGRQFGTTFAIPGIAEKGYTDVEVKVATSGGHSSIPPDHTSIGILAAMLVHLEQHPFELKFNRDDPLYAAFQCFGEHASSMPDDLRNLIKTSATSNDALHRLIEVIAKNHVLKSLIGTTQAIDIINGGIKTNALPEQASAIVNHRIAVSSSLKDTRARDMELLKPLASRFNLTYTAFGESILGGNAAPSQGSLALGDPFHDELEPAPITPQDAAPYQLLSGTIKATYNSHRGLDGTDNVIVAPGMMSGNTDTRHYWKLSPSIFRYNHQNNGDMVFGLPEGIHTVNEYQEIDSFVEMIRFFVTLILNSDESTQL